MSKHDISPTTEGDGSEADGELVQLLSPLGDRVSNPDYDSWVEDIDDDRLKSLYEDMVVIRRIDTEATALQRQGELGLWPPLIGQEAAQIGSGRALRDDDFVFPSYRENGVAYCRGVDYTDLFRVWRGHTHSGWNPYDINIAPPQVIIGAQTLHATGYALGCQQDGVDTAAITYFGDGATSQGDVSESLIFAASYQAPVIFFCQNNQWAISEPVGLQARTPIAGRAPGFGIPSMRIDGNDVLAAMAATRIALDRARTGNGPTFIEAVTYRMGPHTTSDDPSRYIDVLERDHWQAKDPIARVEAYLEGKGLFTEEFQFQVKSQADAVARKARKACLDMEPPEQLSVFDHVYSEPSPWLERQKDQYSRYLQSFEGGH